MDMDLLNFTTNATIKVDNQEIAVNKYVLALSSKYFEKHFDDRHSAAENIELPEPTTIEDFKRMLAILPPKKRQLDDDCVEAILILANRFAMDKVKKMCRIFITSKSNKPKLFKFRMARKYGWNKIEKQILRSMRLSDHNGENFLENAEEFAILNDKAKAVIAARNAELVSVIPNHIPVLPAAQNQTIAFTNAKPDTNITVDKEEVAVNSHILILSSTYFDRYFLDNRYPKAENIELPPTTTIEDFNRMVATLPPEQRELDDDCVEAILILADRFFMDNVMELCRKFLNSPISNKPKLFIYRMAHKYGWSEMKNKIVGFGSMKLDDLSRECDEFELMDDDAKAAFSARHAELIKGQERACTSTSEYCVQVNSIASTSYYCDE